MSFFLKKKCITFYLFIGLIWNLIWLTLADVKTMFKLDLIVNVFRFSLFFKVISAFTLN
jgi:hypothetical protein